LQLTPLCGDKIVLILNDTIHSNVFSVHQCGAGEAQALGGYHQRFTTFNDLRSQHASHFVVA
jgi:hypothetical protein